MLLIKKRYIFLIIIICLFSISAASAEEMDNITAVDNHESPNSNFLADSYSAFGDLENEIYLYNARIPHLFRSWMNCTVVGTIFF